MVSKTALALELSQYRFGFKTIADPHDFLLTEVCFPDDEAERYLKSATFDWHLKLAEAKNYARDLANSRVNTFGINSLILEAEKIRQLNPEKIKMVSLIGKELENAGLCLHYAVGKGSIQPPAAVSLSFMNDPQSTDITAVLGKGLDFDSGGLNVKKYGYMEDMYIDKAGAAAAIAIFRCAVQQNLKVNLVCSIGLAENSISSTCYRPSDIVKSHHVE